MAGSVDNGHFNTLFEHDMSLMEPQGSAVKRESRN